LYRSFQVWDFFSKEKVTGLLLHGMLLYWISKLYELFDTVFMVLRHRVRQITFLHVFHHSTMTLLTDWLFTTFPIPATVPLMFLNSLVHVVMYGYYFLTTLYPLRPLVWKKRITQLQLLQFLFGFVHGSIGYLYHGFCIYCVLYVVALIVLFSNFYYHTYIKGKPLVEVGRKTD
jgi:elongation of very long chain fatty acids protein 4